MVYWSDALAEVLAEALIDEPADALADEFADALAEALALALCVPDGCPGSPTLTLRVIGVPGSAWAPAAGIVPMMVWGFATLVSSLINATSSPASERIWTASPTLRPETSGTVILPSGSVSAAATCAGSGGVCAEVPRTAVVSFAEVASPAMAFGSSALDCLSPEGCPALCGAPVIEVSWPPAPIRAGTAQARQSPTSSTERSARAPRRLRLPRVPKLAERTRERGPLASGTAAEADVAVVGTAP